MAIPKSTRVVDHTMLRLVCPSCGRTLRLSRITSGTDSLPDQHTYSCQPCGVWVIEAADDRVVSEARTPDMFSESPAIRDDAIKRSIRGVLRATARPEVHA